MSLLTVQCTLIVPGLPSLSLEQPGDPFPYQLEAGTREEYGVTFRKQEVSSPFVEGTYLIQAVRENVTEQVNVWVRGRTHMEMDRRIQAVLERVERPRFVTDFRVGSVIERWNCQVASYTVRTQREYQHATMALLRMQIPRLPRITRSYADGAVVTR